MEKVTKTHLEEYISEVQNDAYLFEMLSNVGFDTDFVNSDDFGKWLGVFFKAVDNLKSDVKMLREIFYSLEEK